MKIKLMIITIIVLCSCNTQSRYYGKYINNQDDKIINYLVINNDNTYLHYYKNDTIVLSQKGKWKIYNNTYERIDLYDFCNYNDEGINFKKFGIYFLIKDGNYLNNGFDGNTRGSFEKVK